MNTRDALGPSAVVKLARFMLDSVHEDPTLVARGDSPDRLPSIAEIIHSLNQAASRPNSRPPQTVRPERLLKEPVAGAYGFGRSTRGQPVPLARYLAPAGCVVAVLIALVATMSTSPRGNQPAPLPVQTGPVASSAPDEAAALADLRRQMASETDQLAQLTAERDQLRATIADLSAQAANASRQAAELARQTAQRVEIAQHVAPVTPSPPARHSDPAPSRAERPAAPEHAAHRAPPAQPPREESDVSRQLLQARAALVSGDTYEARRMMKQAQTLILFQPSTAVPLRTDAAISHITQALMMLTAGNQQRALGYLNQALTAGL